MPPLNPFQQDLLALRRKLTALEHIDAQFTPACVHSDPKWYPVILTAGENPKLYYLHLSEGNRAHETAFRTLRSALDLRNVQYRFTPDVGNEYWTLTIDLEQSVLDIVLLTHLSFRSPLKYDSTQTLPPIIYDAPSTSFPPV